MDGSNQENTTVVGETNAAKQDTSCCRFGAIETRLADMRSNFNLVLTIFSTLTAAGVALFGISGIIFQNNLNEEKIALREEQQTEFSKIKESLGLLKTEPKLLIKTVGGRPLDGAIVKANIRKLDKENYSISSPIRFENTGNAGTGPITIKIYFKKPFMPLGEITESSEEGFDFEQYYFNDVHRVHNGERIPVSLPPGLKFQYGLGFSFKGKQALTPPVTSETTFMAEFFYGNDKVERVRYKLTW